MITLREVLVIHQVLVDRFGGAQGVRELGILESAINRPYQTFDQLELYPTAVDKAAAIFESIITNPPFVDGNKRTAYVLMRLTLMSFNNDIKATQAEKYDFVINAARGEIRYDQIRAWISNHLV